MGRRVRCLRLHQLRGIFGMTWPGMSRSRMWTEEWYSALYKLEVGQWQTEPSGCSPVGELIPYWLYHYLACDLGQINFSVSQLLHSYH